MITIVLIGAGIALVIAILQVAFEEFLRGLLEIAVIDVRRIIRKVKGWVWK